MNGTVEQGGTPTRNTKKRSWCFTWNNYENADIEYLKEMLENKARYIFGEEKGNSGTPHLQGVINFNSPRTFKSVRKLLKENHIEECKNWQASINYCSKDGIVHTNMEKKIKEKTLEEILIEAEYKDVIWKTWQQECLNILDKKPDKRKIFWYWENTGNVGKSFLAKYICLKYNCIIATGKSGDIFNQLLKWRTLNPKEPQIPPIIIDNPRSEFGHINYAAIEALKNGFIYSGKYEGGKIYGLSPHIIIMANSEPNYEELSKDRLVVKQLT